MAYEPKPGSGSLFPNDRKGNDKAPSMRGDLCLEDGTTIRIAAWTKTDRNGGKFLSLSIDKPREQSQGGGGRSAEDFRSGGSGRVAGNDRDRHDDFGDEVPF